MSKRQCSHHGSIESQRVTYTQQDTQVYRDRQAFIKQKKIEKCLEKRSGFEDLFNQYFDSQPGLTVVA